MLSILCPFRGNDREFNSPGLLENIIRHVGWTLPFRRIIGFRRVINFVLFRFGALPVFVVFVTLIGGSRIGASRVAFFGLFSLTLRQQPDLNGFSQFAAADVRRRVQNQDLLGFAILVSS